MALTNAQLEQMQDLGITLTSSQLSQLSGTTTTTTPTTTTVAPLDQADIDAIQASNDAYYANNPSSVRPTAPLDQADIDAIQKQNTDYFTSQKTTAAVAVAKYQASQPAPAEIPSTVTSPDTDTATPELPTPQIDSIQQSFSVSAQANVDAARTALENTYKTQIADIDRQVEESNKKIEELTALQTEGVEKVGDILQPYREALEAAERERLYINENFEANQKLTNELDTLLTEGNDLISQQKAVTGLGAIRNPRIDNTISDINARVGVIEAVINARNGQINQAYTMIDRTVAAINADKQDQLTYYSTLLDFYQTQKDDEGKKLVTLDSTKKSFLTAQIDLLQNDLAQTQGVADYIKGLMLDPETASFMAKAGVSIADSVEEINQKMAIQAEFDKKEEEAKDAAGDILSVSEAKALNVPYGTTKKEAYGKVPSGSSGTDTVEIAPEDKRILAGAGFSTQEISAIQNDINQYGINAVLEGITDVKQIAAIKKVYNVADTVTVKQIEGIVTQKVAQDALKDMFTDEELLAKAKEAGTSFAGGFFTGKEKEIEKYLASDQARQDYIEILTGQYRDAGILEE